MTRHDRLPSAPPRWPADATPAGLRAAEMRNARRACRHLWAVAGWATALALAVLWGIG